MALTLFQTAKPKTFLEMAEVNIATATPRKKKTPTEGKRRSARVKWELTGKHVEKTLMPLLQMLPDFRSLGKKNVAIVLGGSASMIKLKNYFLAKQKELCRLCFVFCRLCFVFCRLEISEQLQLEGFLNGRKKTKDMVWTATSTSPTTSRICTRVKGLYCFNPISQ